MIKKEYIENICRQTLTDSQFLVDIKTTASNDIRVYIDDMNGLAIEECKRISRFIESQLEAEELDFSLEVGSPGLTKPFKVVEQYQKNIDKEVEIVYTTGEKLLGKLKEVTAESILVETSSTKKINNKKQLIIESTQVEFKDIKSTKSVLSFK